MVWLLIGVHIRVYVELAYLSFHFADTANQIFIFSAREVLVTSLVNSDLIDNLQKSSSLCVVIS